MLVRATDDTPYVSSYSRLFLREFDHVVTIYLPLNNREGRWASDIYEKQLVETIERYHPTTIASIDIDFTEFDNLRTKFGSRLKKLTPIDIGEHQCLLFKGLDKFLDKVGLSDKKFVLLHRPEQGELFDDRVRACGFPDVEAKEVSTIGELREVLRDVGDEVRSVGDSQNEQVGESVHVDAVQRRHAFGPMFGERFTVASNSLVAGTSGEVGAHLKP